MSSATATATNTVVITPPPPRSSVQKPAPVDPESAKTTLIEELLLVRTLDAKEVCADPELQPGESAWERRPKTNAKPDICPKCDSTTPWKESSWCPTCGFYPGISDIPAQVAAAPKQEEQATERASETATGLSGWITKLIS